MLAAAALPLVRMADQQAVTEERGVCIIPPFLTSSGALGTVRAPACHPGGLMAHGIRIVERP
jgi:hypothetical protein